MLTTVCFGATDVCPEEVVLGDELVVEVFEDWEVYVLQLLRQITPLRVLNQVEEMSLRLIIASLSFESMASIDLRL